MSSSQQSCELQIISFSQWGQSSDWGACPHESRSKAISMQTQSQTVASGADVLCYASLPLRTQAAQEPAWLLFLETFLPGHLLVLVSCWSPFHQSNGWPPSPTAMEACDGHIPPSQPLHLRVPGRAAGRAHEALAASNSWSSFLATTFAP